MDGQGSARGNPQRDSDRDGVIDALDNCPHVANRDQQDTDGDGVGDACDNCPNDFNPAQSDGNGNGTGDACDGSTAASFVLKQVRLAANTATLPSTGNGTIRVRGVLDPADFGGDLRAAVDGGLTIGVRGAGLGATETMVFQRPRCIALGATRFRCVGNRGEVADLRRQRRGTLFNVQITASGRAFRAPLSRSAVQVVLSTGGLDRGDQIDSCRLIGKRVASCSK